MADRLGLPVKSVDAIVASQLNVARQALKGKKDVSLYLRKVGTFISTAMRMHLAWERFKVVNSREKKITQQVEEPYEFK